MRRHVTPCPSSRSPTASAHSAAHTAAVPPCRCHPQLARLCYTSPHHLAEAPLGFFLAQVLVLAAVLNPATDLRRLGSRSRGEHGPSQAWSAVHLGCGVVLCFASASASALALLAKIVCMCTVPCGFVCQPSHISPSMRSNCGYGCVGINGRLWNSRPRFLLPS